MRRLQVWGMLVELLLQHELVVDMAGFWHTASDEHSFGLERRTTGKGVGGRKSGTIGKTRVCFCINTS